MSEEQKLPKGVLRYPDGEPIVVLRPEKPNETVMLAAIAVERQSKEALHAAMDGPLTVLGFLVRRDGKYVAVDADGENALSVEPGDVFAGPNDLYKPS